MLVLQSVLLSVGVDAARWFRNAVVNYLRGDETSDSEEENVIKIESQKSCECTLDEFGLRFWPPLYVQRYLAVQDVILHPIWNGTIRNVVDFGCAEFGFFKYLKTIPTISNIILVDVDDTILDMHMPKVMPTNYDYLSSSKRELPLTVDIYNGSIADLDDRMLGVDAVVCIELIEHLNSDVLDVVPYTVFEFIKPKVAIFSTPNSEFNILFPNFTKQFRHDDHKFEWNRQQFKVWASKITTRYPEYSVQFNGIGKGPVGTENLGSCSQMVIFYRKDMKTSPVEPSGETPYKLMKQLSYPYNNQNEHISKQFTVFDCLNKFFEEVKSNESYLVEDNLEVPFSKILPYISEYCSSEDEFINIVNRRYETKKNDCGEWVLIKHLSEFSSDEYMSDVDSYSNQSAQEYSLLDEFETDHHYDKVEWNTHVESSFGESKLCFSTPMTKNQDSNIYFSDKDIFDTTIFTNSDLYNTAIDYNRSEHLDMEISSSCNGSFIVDDCNVYQDFISGRNNSSIEDEDITEKTLTGVVNDNDLNRDNDKANGNVLIRDNTVLENDSQLLPKNDTNGTHESQTIKDFSTDTVSVECQELDNQPTVFFNRTLLDESGFMENLLSTPDKE